MLLLYQLLLFISPQIIMLGIAIQEDDSEAAPLSADGCSWLSIVDKSLLESVDLLLCDTRQPHRSTVCPGIRRPFS